MIVYVVLYSDGYEGYSAPFGVYSTLEKAKERIRELASIAKEGFSIEEYEVDVTTRTW